MFPVGQSNIKRRACASSVAVRRRLVAKVRPRSRVCVSPAAASCSGQRQTAVGCEVSEGDDGVTNGQRSLRRVSGGSRPRLADRSGLDLFETRLDWDRPERGCRLRQTSAGRANRCLREDGRARTCAVAAWRRWEERGRLLEQQITTDGSEMHTRRGRQRGRRRWWCRLRPFVLARGRWEMGEWQGRWAEGHRQMGEGDGEALEARRLATQYARADTGIGGAVGA